MSDLITVIVPVYNVEPYLRTCLDSIIHQTYTTLEILLIVSDSDDASSEICDEYALKDRRIQVIHQPVFGLSYAKNTGLDLASGEYINFVDPDDFVALVYIETLYNLCKENNCNISQCNFRRIDNTVHTETPDTKDEKITLYSGKEMCYAIYSDKVRPGYSSWARLYHKTCFENIRYPVGKLFEDMAVVHVLFYYIDMVAVTNRVLYYYRIHEASIMQSPYTLVKSVDLEYLPDIMKFFSQRDEKVLYSLTRVRYFQALSSNLQNTKKYIENSDAIQSELRKKRSFIYRQVIIDRNIPLKRKALITLIGYFPKTTRVLVKIKSDLKR